MHDRKNDAEMGKRTIEQGGNRRTMLHIGSIEKLGKTVALGSEPALA
jgi:hypothetical protein